MSKQITDPGFGTRVVGRGRILRKDGSSNVRRSGTSNTARDLYHAGLRISWTQYLLWTTITYIALVIFFGWVYLLIGIEGLQGARVSPTINALEDAVFFSAQTLTTVGYGTLAPTSTIVRIVSSVEAMAGLVLFGVLTGLAFGRFARHKPRISFSTNAVVAPFKSETNGLMIRLASERDGMIMDAQSTLLLIYENSSEQVANGMARRQFYQLDLTMPRVTLLTMNWTIVHELTPDSPFQMFTLAELEERNAELILIFQAFDETVGQQFYARTSYKASEVLVGHRYIPMFWESTGGVVELNLNLLCATESAEIVIPT